MQTPASTPSSQQHLSSSSSIDEGRFLPGTLLAARYRIVALLGRGGMGEVYRANDLKLGQPVALKFLPEAMATNETTLARFYNEIRIARQVSHPNVCRVYDLGDVEGQPYLSMEYVDGEDLGSLMRRIGRLPADKALEIARKLCAGLAAAHDKGVLHRDLKPSNIMLDGRGNVLIADFGLAGLASQIQGAEVRNGTPAYMAPEQLAGREVTTRSDIYALGLVLYEVFTGKRAFEAATLAELVRLHTETAPVNPSTLVKDLDPAVERVILRCLDPDPRNRPASALAVAAALPGGDPLAAALAAGETPSPQMVAASGETAGLPVRVALACLAFVLVALAVYVFAGPRSSAIDQLGLEKPPEVLNETARNMIRNFGYTSHAIDRAYGFGYQGDFLNYVQAHEKPGPSAWPKILEGWPNLAFFWYRESPRYLVPSDFRDQALTPGIVTTYDPPVTQSGMIKVVLDPQGRLEWFEAIPPEVDKTPPVAQPFDWKPLLSAAGLDAGKLKAAEPEWNSLAVFDTRAAWTGTWPGTQRALRVEAAAWRGKPVYFAMIGAWTHPYRMQPEERSTGHKAADVISTCLLILVLGGAVWLARWNHTRGRGDRQGAIRLALFVFCAQSALWITRSHLVPDISTFGSFIIMASTALFISGCVWILYLALEPYVRRHWPQAIISWTRMSSGRIRDPLVGRDVLFGTVLGVSWVLIFIIDEAVLSQFGSQPNLGNTDYFLGARSAVGAILYQIPNSVVGTLIFFFLIFLLRAILRKQWLAASGFVLIYTAMKCLGSDHPWANAPFAILIYAIVALVVSRFGLIALAAGIFVADLVGNLPATADFSAWYASGPIFALVVVAALAVWGFHTSLGGQPIFSRELFD
ncbi:MAG TPA: serine/threonine-protein kinase [Bryobacteraceae bacterium]|nr:serine/threonine-protein kinase [Bryobacteraceae bacterium]